MKSILNHLVNALRKVWKLTLCLKLLSLRL